MCSDQDKREPSVRELKRIHQWEMNGFTAIDSHAGKRYDIQ
jgi:hypothetical protein